MKKHYTISIATRKTYLKELDENTWEIKDSIIYEGKRGLKAELWNSGKMHWRSVPNTPISTAWFYYKDGDATEYRIREYFNF